MNIDNCSISVLECFNAVSSKITYGSQNIKPDNLFLFSSNTEVFNSSSYLKACSLTEKLLISFTLAEPPYLASVSTNSTLILSSKSNNSESTPSYLLSVWIFIIEKFLLFLNFYSM